MIASPGALRALIGSVLDDLARDGRDVTELRAELAATPDDLQRLCELALRVDVAPLRSDWPYEEPDDLADIEAAAEEDDWERTVRVGDPIDVAASIATAFLGRVAGCVLGKPFELELTAVELRRRLEAAGSWPLNDYLTEAALGHLPVRHEQWRELVRERITHVPPDDDLNYTVLAMLGLEHHGASVAHGDLTRLWQRNLPVAATFGPERARLLADGWVSLVAFLGLEASTALLDVPLPGRDLCGALIRADAYGYACPGAPGRAARLAHRDATLTHRRTGVYGAMWVAATIAAALGGAHPIAAARTGLRYVPARGRFHEAVSAALAIVADAPDAWAANAAIVERYPEYGHCRVLQEVGTVVVTLRFARDVGDGVCLQVMQGNDTDSFAATAGSILGAALGPEHLDPRWLRPFNDTIHLALALFEPPPLSQLAARMARLPPALDEARDDVDADGVDGGLV